MSEAPEAETSLWSNIKENQQATPSLPKKRGRKSNAELAAMGRPPYQKALTILATAEPEKTTEKSAEKDSEGRRTLPDNFTDAERELRAYRQPAAMVVNALDAAVIYAKTTPFRQAEKEQGETAIATVLYEEGMTLSGRLLLLLWILTVLSSRVVEYFDNRRKEANAARALVLQGKPVGQT